MTDCGHLSSARPLQRELAGGLAFRGDMTIVGSLPARLAAYRAADPLDEQTSLILFGVGLETLQRIERGEVEPGDELIERLGNIIGPGPTGAFSPCWAPAAGGSPTGRGSSPAVAPPEGYSHSPASAGVLPARDRAGAQGDEAGRVATASSPQASWRAAQPDGPTFARRGGGIRMWLGGAPHDFTFSEALALRAGLDRALEGKEAPCRSN